jgi:sugar lactone lactonase YvrE
MSTFWPVTPSITAELVTPGGVASPHQIKLTINNIADHIGNIVRVYKEAVANAKWRFELEPGTVTQFQVGDLFLTNIPPIFSFMGGSVAGKVLAVISPTVIEVDVISSLPNINNSYAANLIPTRYGSGYTLPVPWIRHTPYPELFRVEVRRDGGAWQTLFYSNNSKVGNVIYHRWLVPGTYEYKLTIQSDWQYPGVRILASSIYDYLVSETTAATAVVTVPSYPVPTQYTAISDLAVTLAANKPVLTWTAPSNVPALCYNVERKYVGGSWQRIASLQMVPVNNTYTDNTADITKTASYRVRYYTYTPAIYPGLNVPPFGIHNNDPLDWNDDGLVDIYDIRKIVADTITSKNGTSTLGYPDYDYSEYDYYQFDSGTIGNGLLGRLTAPDAANFSMNLNADGVYDSSVWHTLRQYYNSRSLSAISGRSNWSNEATLYSAPFARYVYFSGGNSIVRAQINGLGRQVILESSQPVILLEFDRRNGLLYYVTGAGSSWYLRRTGIDGVVNDANYEDCLVLASRPTAITIDYESNTLLWTVDTDIYAANTVAWSPSVIIAHTDNVLAIRYSSASAKLYYVDAALALRSCDADGSNDVLLTDLSSDIDSCADLAVNSTHVFIADSVGGKVARYILASGLVTVAAALTIPDSVSVDADEQSCWIVARQSSALCYLYRWDLVAVAAELRQISEYTTTIARFAEQGVTRASAPSNIAASRAGGTVTITWHDSVPGKSNFEVYAYADDSFYEQLVGVTSEPVFEHVTNLTLSYRVRAVIASPPATLSSWTNPLHALAVNGNYHVNGRDYVRLYDWLATVAAGDTPDPLGPPNARVDGDPYLDVSGNGVINHSDLAVVAAYLFDIASEYSAAVTPEPPIIDPPVDEAGCPNFVWWGINDVYSTADLWLGGCDDAPSNGEYKNAALLFTCNVPAGSVIVDAYIEFTAAGSSGGSNIQLLIAAENNSNAVELVDSDEAEASASDLLVNTVPWAPTAGWIDSQKYQTPDISAIIQEYIELPGYAAGNKLMLHIMDDNLVAEPNPRHVRVEEPCVSSLNPRLVITYTDPDTTTPEESSSEEPTTIEPTEVDCHHLWLAQYTRIVAVDLASYDQEWFNEPSYQINQYVSDVWLDYINQKIYFTIYFHDAVTAPKGGMLLVLDMATGVYTTIKIWDVAQGAPIGLAVDVDNDLAYILHATALNAAKIITVSLIDATETQIVAQADIGGIDYRPTHFVVDFTSGYIYTSTLELGDAALTRFDIDGTNKTNLITGLASVTDIFISLTDAKIYFGALTVGAAIGGVYRADLDGSDVVKLLDADETGVYCYSLTYDEQAATFYVSYANRVYRCFLSGDTLTPDVIEFYNDTSAPGGSRINNLLLCGTYGDAPSTGGSTEEETTTSVEPAGEARYLFWLDHLKDTETVPYSRIRGTNKEPAWIDTILSYPDLSYARCVKGSLKFGRYFWSDYRGYIYSCLFDGSDVKLVTDQIPGPYGIAVDEINDCLFVADFYSSAVVKVNLHNGTATVIVSGVINVVDIAVNVTSTELYFTAGDKIYATTVSGGGVRTVLDFSNSAIALFGLDIDSVENELYFVNPLGNAPASFPCVIQRIKTDGTGLATIISNIQYATNCVLDTTTGHIFWQEPFQNKIRRANMDGTNVITFVSEAGSVYTWVALLDTPDVTTTEEPPSTEEPTSTPDGETTPEPSTEEPTTPEPTTREPDITGELEQIAVDQHQGGTVYPFIWPSDDLGNLIGDLYLAINAAGYTPPFSIKQLLNFNQNATSRYEVVIVDANNTVVFDTTASLPEQFKQYAWTDKRRIIEYADANGQVLRLVVYTVQESPIAWDEVIEPTDGRLDPRTIELIPANVAQLAVRTEDGTIVELPPGTNVVLQNGYNTVLATEAFDVNGGVAGVVLTVNADQGSGLGRYPGCESTIYLQTINKVGPDDKGNIRIKFAGPGASKQNCYWLERPVSDVSDNDEVSVAPNTLKLHNNCGPCCKCSDMLNVYQAIRRLYNKYKRLGRRAEVVRDTLRRIHDRWKENAQCRSATALRAALMPLNNCKMAFGVGLCNNLADSIKGIRLKIDFTGSSVTGCLRCASVYRGGNVDPTKSIPRGRPWPYKLSGTWPIFYADFDCVDAATLATITGQLELDGVTGDTITVTVSVDGNNPGEAKPVTESAVVNCEVDSSESCCEADESTTAETGSAQLQIASITSNAMGKIVVNLSEPLPFAIADGHMITIVATSRNVSNGNFTTAAASAGSRTIVTTSDWAADSVGGYVEL